MEDDEISALTGFSKVPRHLQGSGGNVIIEGMSNVRPRSQSQEGFNTVSSQRLFQTMHDFNNFANRNDVIQNFIIFIIFRISLFHFTIF